MHSERAEMSELFLRTFYSCELRQRRKRVKPCCARSRRWRHSRLIGIALLVLVASARLFAQAPVAGSSSTSAAVINNARICNGFNGVTAGDKIAAAKADLPSTGGTLDCTGIEGTITSDIFAGETRPIFVKFGSATFSLLASMNFPATVAVYADHGALFNIASGVTVTFSQFSGSPSKHFILTGTGKATFGSNGLTSTLHPEWWGLGDGATGDGVAIGAACDAMPNNAVMEFPRGVYALGAADTARCTISPDNVTMSGAGLGTTTLTYTSTSPGTLGPGALFLAVKHSGMVVQDMTIQDLNEGTAFTFSTHSPSAIDTFEESNIFVRRVEFIDIKGNAAITGGSCENFYIEDCIFRWPGGTPDWDAINIG